jgi:hypothetical protein
MGTSRQGKERKTPSDYHNIRSLIFFQQMMFGLAKPVPAAPAVDAEDDTTSDDVEAELAAMRTKPKPAMKVITLKIIFLYKIYGFV